MRCERKAKYMIKICIACKHFTRYADGWKCDDLRKQQRCNDWIAARVEAEKLEAEIKAGAEKGESDG